MRCGFRYLEALGVRAVAFGSLVEAADAGYGASADINHVGPEVLLLAVDVAPRADHACKASSGRQWTEGSGGNFFSPGLGDIADVAKRGWRRCSLP